MKRTRTTTSLFLTVSALLVVFQGCNTSTDLQPVPQNSDGGSAGTGGSPVVGPGDTGGSNTTSTTPGNNTGGAANNGQPALKETPKAAAQPAARNRRRHGRRTLVPNRRCTLVSNRRRRRKSDGRRTSYPTGGAQQTQLAGPRAWQRRRVGHRCRVEDRRAPGIRATVTIANGKALGAMTGWGFVAMGTTDTVSDPHAGPGKPRLPRRRPALPALTGAARRRFV